MGYQHYTRTDIQTSDPRAVVVLLYEGAVKYLNRAVEAARRDERMAVSEGILKTQKIIQFLANALDFDAGGEVADNMNRLYAYMRDTLNDANLHCDIEKITEVIALFKPLLESWRGVAQDPEAAAALEARPSPFNPRQGLFELTSGEENQNAAPVAPSAPPAPDSPAPTIALASAAGPTDRVQLSGAAPAPPADAAAGRAAYRVSQSG